MPHAIHHDVSGMVKPPRILWERIERIGALCFKAVWTMNMIVHYADWHAHIMHDTYIARVQKTLTPSFFMRLLRAVACCPWKWSTRVMLGHAYETLAAMYLQWVPPIAKNKSTTHSQQLGNNLDWNESLNLQWQRIQPSSQHSPLSDDLLRPPKASSMSNRRS